MEKINLISLKNIDLKKISSEFSNYFKDSDNYRDLPLKMISLAFVTYIYKSRFPKNGIEDYILGQIKDETSKEYLIQFYARLDFEIVDLYSKMFSTIELVAYIFSNDFDNYDSSTTPQGIIELSMAILNIQEGDTVFDLGSGTGNFLSHVANNFDANRLLGVEINTNNFLISNLRKLTIDKNIDYIQNDILNFDILGLKADKIFMHAPFGLRWLSATQNLKDRKKFSKYLTGTKSNVSGDWIFALIALFNQKNEGKTVVLMSNAGTWNNADKLIRKRVIEEGRIEGVIALPTNLFNGTSISTTLIVFSQNNKSVKMVDATQIYTKGRRINSLEKDDIEKILKHYNSETENCCVIGTDVLRQHEYILNPSRYKSSNEVTNGISLGELCLSINRGAMITSGDLDKLVSEDETNFKYLMLKNIQNGIIDNDLPNLKYIEENNYKYCIRNGDLIISKISPFKIARASFRENTKILANGNLYFLELDESKINPVFVEFYLQSESGINQLERLAKGTAIHNISIQDLKNVQIPNITREKQDEIAVKYSSFIEDLQILERQAEMIRKKREALVEEIY